MINRFVHPPHFCGGCFWHKKRRQQPSRAWSKRETKREVTLDRSFDMPQSGVTSVRSWYLTSFVILSVYCLSVCLTLLTVSNANKIFLNGEYRGFGVLLLCAERRILYLVALAVVRCRFTPMPSVFRTVRIVYMSTNYTHMESLLANQ